MTLITLARKASSPRLFTSLWPLSVRVAINEAANRQEECIAHGSGGEKDQEQGAGRFGLWWGPPSSLTVVFSPSLQVAGGLSW